MSAEVEVVRKKKKRKKKRQRQQQLSTPTEKKKTALSSSSSSSSSLKKKRASLLSFSFSFSLFRFSSTRAEAAREREREKLTPQQPCRRTRARAGRTAGEVRRMKTSPSLSPSPDSRWRAQPIDRRSRLLARRSWGRARLSLGHLCICGRGGHALQALRGVSEGD